MKLDYNLAWRFLNDVCFEGELTHSKILCFKGSLWGHAGNLLVGAYHCDSSEILLHTGVHSAENPGGTLETLYHEMVHQYINEVLDATYDGADHGRLFHETYNIGLERLDRWLRRWSKARARRSPQPVQTATVRPVLGLREFRRSQRKRLSKVYDDARGCMLQSTFQAYPSTPVRR